MRKKYNFFEIANVVTGGLLIICMLLGALAIVVMLSSCNEKKKLKFTTEMVTKSTYDSLAKSDSIIINKQHKLIDSLFTFTTPIYEKVKAEKAINKKLKDSLFQQNWRIVKAKHYIRIVQRNPHNLPFLIGWLNNQCFN